MKNINLNIASYGALPLAQPSPQPPFAKPIEQIITYSVSFSAQFDNEKAARAFAKSLLIHLEDYQRD